MIHIMTASLKKPTNVNVRNPLAIERIMEEVESGRARNFSEAAENMILRDSGRRRDQQLDTEAPASMPAPAAT